MMELILLRKKYSQKNRHLWMSIFFDKEFYNEFFKKSEEKFCSYYFVRHIDYIEYFDNYYKDAQRLASAETVIATERLYIKLQLAEENSPYIIRNGAIYLNLDVTINGKKLVFVPYLYAKYY